MFKIEVVLKNLMDQNYTSRYYLTEGFRLVKGLPPLQGEGWGGVSYRYFGIRQPVGRCHSMSL
jgi:hypothetical protein